MDFESQNNTHIFELIVDDIVGKGYSIHENALPINLVTELSEAARLLAGTHFKAAGVGRDAGLVVNHQIRSDNICWIADDCNYGIAWFKWVEALKLHLNRRLFLGLGEVESHFAHYRQGDFYQKHKDAFHGQANRVLSMVTYLNPDWREVDGGELLIYSDDSDHILTKVTPSWGTIVLFLSEEFPHEVLPAKCDRYSIATWFRQTNIS
ncbi:2OG-Fe(II) oxygenase [Shewanella sp. VB17]|uniref:2OG-Fe(II) oxygenase n=1 Tax=Shewanella sp. VB17 TaxID=2739432 RepID=UPI0020B74F16|nr:2OG-Fe(II) oxygenase [Shewanella sp. VB17]